MAQVPRVECTEHGVRQVSVAWGEPGSRFTALFEALVIDWLQEASIAAVARQLKLGWEETAGIMDRAVRRGLARRQAVLPPRMGVDEVSFQKHHEYVTVVHDPTRGVVVHVADGRDRECLDSFYRDFPEEARTAVESVTMDMWAAYIASTEDFIPGAEGKIAFDKFVSVRPTHLPPAGPARQDQRQEVTHGAEASRVVGARECLAAVGGRVA